MTQCKSERSRRFTQIFCQRLCYYTTKWLLAPRGGAVPAFNFWCHCQTVRLTHLRLAGFKSFVEPTSVSVPSNLVGVVGPNGCGKSNIIDAVRWVLGESKASELRGESMQDVIFNGSTNRKPASRASVELVFDNSEGRAGGSWNQFAEISVKRVLTRDGSSTYYINQQAVRRRDVQDIFMGTGLGPRAYAIIGQGMIARIIEARPEELRVFLEEAAGVSKYKERRRETGNRLQDTRDNLTRIEDILRELTSQIERLESQAEVARKYKDFESEKTSKQHLLWAIRLKDGLEQKDRFSAKRREAEAELERLQSDSISTQTELLAIREKQIQNQQALESSQSAWIEANRNVSRLEADIRVMAESKSRLINRLKELELEEKVWADRLIMAKERSDAGQEEVLIAKESTEEFLIAFEEAQLALEPVQQMLFIAKEEVDKRRTRVLDIQREISQATAQRDSASRTKDNLKLKIDRIVAEQSQLVTPSDDELRNAQSNSKVFTEDLISAKLQLEKKEDETKGLEAQLTQVQSEYQIERDRQANTKARLEALAGLEAQLTQEGELQPWLQSQNLADLPKLIGKIQVEAGWERALESALRESLDSVITTDLSDFANKGALNPPQRVAILETRITTNVPEATPTTLASVVSCSDRQTLQAIYVLLNGFEIASSLQEALQKRHSLGSGRKIVVKEGHVIGHNSVNIYAAENEQAGRLERQQQIAALNTELRALEMLCSESEAKRDQLQGRCKAAKNELNIMRQRVEQLTRQIHDCQLKVLRLEEAQSRADARANQLSLDKAVLESELEEQHALLYEAEDLLMELEDRLGLASESLEDQKNKVTQLERELHARQEAVQTALRQRQDAEFNLRTLESTLREAQRDINFAQAESAKVKERQQITQAELNSLSASDTEEALQNALEERVITEEQVAVARDQLEQIMSKVSELEKLEKNNEKLTDPLRQAIQDFALKAQAAELTVEQYQTNLDEAQADKESLMRLIIESENLPSASGLQADVTRLVNSMQALGAVNLAALDELAAAQERKTYLDRQAADLIEAMNTLEDAIRKIDMETRELLSETFDAVNAQFSRLFPLLFGGGDARLVMTGDEILDAGVQVFAQPPGKKNGTIHLLSGGEKALTATALVFAIFELNPAPFCLLDEVDAPLDDANTERFSKLVKQMSERTQFLFISHNKIAMEMAQQLIGVTMQEKGVSRIVAVDLASAEKLATETV